ncbi:MAG: DHA2 family efflux MFS transporter permease subunit [Proteobacteria bacterium]|nr:DHA2 family efflux MFS transporter permease subunit [Pseudomonadota bacterium]
MRAVHALPDPSPPHAPPPSRAWVVATLMLGTMSMLLSSTIVNVAFPAIVTEMRIGQATVQWVATGFLAATTATMLGTGWALECYGERRTFMATLAVFLAGSLLGAFAPTPAWLIAGRVLQGAAAGIMQPLAMVVLFRVFPVAERGRAMGIYGFGIVLAPAIGPTLGGMLVVAFGWRWIFALSMPFCVAALALAPRMLENHAARPDRRFDTVGCVLLIGALVAALNVPVLGARDGWTSPGLAGVALAAAGLAVAFVTWELHTPAPMLAVRLFRHPGFTAASLVAFAYGAGLFGTTYLIPVFVEAVARYDAARAGNLLLLPGLALAVAIAIGGRMTDRTGPRRIVLAGLALFAASSALLMTTGSATSFWTFAAWLVVGRIGLGLIIPALNVGAVQSLTGPEIAYASSGVNFVRQLGGAAGVNLLAVYLDRRLAILGPGDAERAFHESFLWVALAFAIALVPAWALRKPHT